MEDGSILALGASEIRSLLRGTERDLLEVVRDAYLAHRRRESALPHSTFLRFPGQAADRIIALPAYLGDGFEVAGVKWIASFPGNLSRGLARASAVLVLNSCDDGRPTAILEGSIVSARRTAASAALAARELTAGQAPIEEAGLVGTGLINFETARFLRVALPSLRRFLLFDLDPERAGACGERLRRELPGCETERAASAAAVLARCRLTAFATTAVDPHVEDLSICPAGATILHTSLRDLATDAVLRADNVVDDVDHVCREGTSMHLTERRTGSREFIRCTLADVLAGAAAPKRDPDAVTVFSPFGLGVLDLAVGHFALTRARRQNLGRRLDAFLPAD